MSNPLQLSPSLTSQSYERKIYRLQTDNITLKDELQGTRLRLRNLEEIQLKYELLLGQSQNENRFLRLNEVQLQKKLTEQIQIIIEQKDRQLQECLRQKQQQHNGSVLMLRQKHQEQKEQLNIQYNQLKQLYESIQSKSSEIDVFSFKLKKYEKQIAELEEQLEAQKLIYEQSKQREVSEMKLNISKKLKSKYDKQIESYQQKVKELSKRVNDLQLENDLLNEKTKNIAISEHSSNIEKLKSILSQRKGLERQQKDRLQEALDKANSSIRKIIEEKYQSEQNYLDKQEQLKNYIIQLQNQLMEQQKSHTRQILTLQQKMRTIKEQEINELREQIELLKDKFENQKQLWENLSQEHGQEIKKLRDDHQKTRTEFEQQKNRYKLKIKDLKDRLEDTQGKRLEGETQQMISSLRDIDGRQDKQASYENGIVFFQKQLSKANINIAKKDKQIAKLLEQVTRLRQQNQNEVSGWMEKYKNDKKQFMDKIFSLQNEVRDLSDKLRFKERQLQKKEKQTSFKALQLQKQIQTLQDINSELRKDYDRAVATKKTLEQQYRGQRDRGVSAKGDANYAKRMKWLELEKQKNELNIIFREKEEHLKIVYEKQIDELRNQRDIFKQKATLLEDEKTKLKNDLAQLQKKLENKENFNNGVSSKKKSGQMEKKIASLNLEIALTKNLFDNLQKAKSRLKNRDFTHSVERIDQQPINREDLQNEEDYTD